MYYVEVKAPGGVDGDEHYRAAALDRRDACRRFWDKVDILSCPLVDSEEVLEDDGNYDTLLTATGTHPDYEGRVTVTMYWED